MAHLTRRKRINARRRKVNLLRKMYKVAEEKVRKRTFNSIKFNNPINSMSPEKQASLAEFLKTHTIHFGPEGWSISHNLEIG